MKGKVIAISISERKGTGKKNIGACELIEGAGLKDDAHIGSGHRQVSLLAIESINKMKRKGLDIGPGDFAENITTQGIDLVSLPVGVKLMIGKKTIIEVSQIGKVCPRPCAIFNKIGYCIMPKEGIFAIVLKGGVVKVGDEITQQI